MNDNQVTPTNNPETINGLINEDEETEYTMWRNPIKWFKQQITGWHTANYCLFWFAVGSQLMLLVTGKIDLLSVVTFIGTVLGVLCIVSINASKSVNGILGLISACCLIFVGFKAKNYLSCFEQLAYILTLDLPVILSVKTWNSHTQEHLRYLTPKKWIWTFISIAIVWVISSLLIGHFTNDPRPWIDGITFAVALIAGILCFLRYNSMYILFFINSICSIILWAVTFVQGGATLAMLVSSCVYLANDIIAFLVSPWFNKGRRKMGLADAKHE